MLDSTVPGSQLLPSCRLWARSGNNFKYVYIFFYICYIFFSVVMTCSRSRCTGSTERYFHIGKVREEKTHPKTVNQGKGLHLTFLVSFSSHSGALPEVVTSSPTRYIYRSQAHIGFSVENNI